MGSHRRSHYAGEVSSMSIYWQGATNQSLLVVALTYFLLDLKTACAYYAGNTGKEVVQGMISFRPGEVAEA